MLVVAATLAIQALVTMAVLAPPVFATLAAPEIGVDAGQIGFYTACVYAAACVSSLLAGQALRRWGAIRSSQIALLLCGVGIALVASARLPLVLIGALVIGLGYGPVTPASSHLLIHQTPARWRTLVFSVKQTGVPLGGALAGLVVPPIVLAAGWKAAALSVAAASLLLAALVQPGRSSWDAAAPPAAASRGTFDAVRLVFRTPALRSLALASFTFSATQLCFGAFIVTFLTHRIGLDLAQAGGVLATAQIAGVVARVVWGWIGDRLIAPIRLLGLLGIAMAAAGALVGFFTAAWPLAALFAVALVHGATAIGWNGVYLAEVARIAPPGAAGLATGGALFVTFLGIVVAPPLFSLAVTATGSYRFAFCTLALAALSGGLACLHAARREA